MKRRSRRLRRILLTLCSALILAGVSVGATLAYLTDSESVVNTFTVGQVHIKLDEEKTNADGEGQDTRTEQGNEYKLMPGHTYTKDPTVTVLQNSSDCYVRMLVTVNNIADLKKIFPDDVAADGTFLLQNFVTGWDSSVWTFEKATAGTESDTCVYEFRYKTVVPGSDTAPTTLPALFTAFTLPGEGVGNDEIKALSSGYNLSGTSVVAAAGAPALKIDVVAHAIQADGFDAADGAWQNFTETANS